MIARLVVWWAKQNEYGVGSVEFNYGEDSWDVELSEIAPGCDEGEQMRTYYGNHEHEWIDDNTPRDDEANMIDAFWHAVKAARGVEFAEAERAKFEALNA